MNTFFLQGLQHPFSVPGHLIALFALALLFGLHQRKHVLFALSTFVVFTLIGLFLTRFYRPDLDIEIILLSISAIIGIITAAKFLLPKLALLVLAGIVGISIGIDSEVIIIPGLKASTAYVNMFGTVLSVSFTLSLATLVSIALSPLWHSIIVRILGSWVFASSLMVLVFMLAPKT